MNEREALKLALDALELNNKEWKSLADSGDAGYWLAEEQNHYQQTEQAITAIKEALAQQCVCGEPNSSGTHRTDGPCLAPQPEQEPVGEIGWAANIPNTIREVNWTELCPPVGTKLYTAPPQRTWVGLTDDEFEDIELGCRSTPFGKIEAMRMVEAKLKEKNFD